MIKIIVKLKTSAIIQANKEVLHITYVISNIVEGILVVFHNRSNYDYHFIIKKIAKEFQGEFNCLEENTEKIKINHINQMRHMRHTKHMSHVYSGLSN